MGEDWLLLDTSIHQNIKCYSDRAMIGHPVKKHGNWSEAHLHGAPYSFLNKDYQTEYCEALKHTYIPSEDAASKPFGTEKI